MLIGLEIGYRGSLVIVVRWFVGSLVHWFVSLFVCETKVPVVMQFHIIMFWQCGLPQI